MTSPCSPWRPWRAATWRRWRPCAGPSPPSWVLTDTVSDEEEARIIDRGADFCLHSAMSPPKIAKYAFSLIRRYTTYNRYDAPETLDAAQKVRQQRRRPTKMGDMGLFSGLLYCADCVHTLHLNRTKSWAREMDNYTCGTYKQKKGLCTAHYIWVSVLEALVLENIRKVIALARVDENELLQQIVENKTEERQKAQAKAKQQLARQERRMGEIDGIIKRLYEDNVTGKLTDERFTKLSGDYEQEQAQLRASTAKLRRTVEASREQETNAKQFLKLAKSYIEPDELTAAMLHAPVDLSTPRTSPPAIADSKSTSITISWASSTCPVRPQQGNQLIPQRAQRKRRDMP